MPQTAVTQVKQSVLISNVSVEKQDERESLVWCRFLVKLFTQKMSNIESKV